MLVSIASGEYTDAGQLLINERSQIPLDPRYRVDSGSAQLASSQQITWNDNATNLRGRLDQDFTFICSSSGRVGSVWGTNTYTDDSSICSAAVHAGLITARDGGVVTIRIRPGEDSYAGTNRNGVRSSSYGSWSGSFIFLNSMGSPVSAEPVIPFLEWSDTATGLRGRLDQDFTFSCPSSGRVGSVWGTNTYTDDSSICSAAVHAGLITARDGGVVTIRIRPGEDSYAGTNRNGVRSSSYGSWSGSFIFLR
ncbi:LCCL domain-containing protein [Microcystis ichthyoblabe FBCC-A1114]|uniref:LCCL domain-containing protein n=1 Tax=Microcystis TaxID=1125 RepID=UPI001930A7C1|nr:LCCL domain-containing protein [Microcystis aeruginosa]